MLKNKPENDHPATLRLCVNNDKKGFKNLSTFASNSYLPITIVIPAYIFYIYKV